MPWKPRGHSASGSEAKHKRQKSGPVHCNVEGFGDTDKSAFGDMCSTYLAQWIVDTVGSGDSEDRSACSKFAGKGAQTAGAVAGG